MYPILRPAIATIIGMVGANFCLLRFRFSPYITLALLALAVAFTIIAYFGKPFKKNTNLFGASALVAFALLGAVLFQWRFLNVELASTPDKRFRSGAVITELQEKEKWWTLKLRESQGGVTLAYIAKNDSVGKPDIVLGDSIYFLTYFNYPTSPYLRKIQDKEREEKRRRIEEKKRQRKSKKHKKGKASDEIAGKYSSNDSIDASMEGYKRYLFYQGVSTVAFVSEGLWGYDYADDDGRNKHLQGLPLWHNLSGKMRTHYSKAGFSSKAEAIMDAMTTGDKSSISKQTKENFSKAGISHVLALSGFHLTVIVALLDIFLMRGLFKRRWRKITALLIIPFIWAFTFIAGLPPSLVRATTMCSFLQLALVIGHEQQLRNACGIAVLIMILANPLYIMDVGFQLSFLSIIGIAEIGVPICRKCGEKFGKWAYLTDIVCISVVCTLFTFPVVAYHFGQIPVYSIISNLFVSVVATLFMWAAVMWWMFIWWTMVNDWLTAILDFLANAMMTIADKVAALPCSTISYKPSIIEVIILYVAIVFAIYFAKRKTTLLQ